MHTKQAPASVPLSGTPGGLRSRVAAAAVFFWLGLACRGPARWHTRPPSTRGPHSVAPLARRGGSQGSRLGESHVGTGPDPASSGPGGPSPLFSSEVSCSSFEKEAAGATQLVARNSSEDRYVLEMEKESASGGRCTLSRGRSESGQVRWPCDAHGLRLRPSNNAKIGKDEE